MVMVIRINIPIVKTELRVLGFFTFASKEYIFSFNYWQLYQPFCKFRFFFYA